MNVKSESEVAQLFPTLSDPMDCSLPGSSAHGIFQARVYWSGVPLPSPLFRLEMAYFLKILHSQIILDSRFTFKEQAGERATKDLVYYLDATERH